MITVNLDNLNRYVNELGYDAKIQKETNQVFISIKTQGKEFPLFIRIYEQNDLVQLLAFMPAQITPGTHADLARLLHLINKEMDIPGFGMDESAGVAFYRLMIPVIDDKVKKEILQSYLKSIEMICDSISPPVLAVASGKVTYAEIVRKAKEASQQSKKV